MTTPHVISVFYELENPNEPYGDCIAYAINEEGLLITSHYSSNYSWAMHDMGFGNSVFKHNHYNDLFPDGWELVWCGDIPPAYTQYATEENP